MVIEFFHVEWTKRVWEREREARIMMEMNKDRLIKEIISEDEDVRNREYKARSQ